MNFAPSRHIKKNPTLRVGGFGFGRARGETRTPKVITPTASETATFTNFATRAGRQRYKIVFCPQTQHRSRR